MPVSRRNLASWPALPNTSTVPLRALRPSVTSKPASASCSRFFALALTRYPLIGCCESALAVEQSPSETSTASAAPLHV